MGLFDLGANVVLRFKADVQEAKAAIKDLSGEEKKAAEARLKQLEAGNKALEKQSKNWQLAAQIIGGGAAAYALANKGLEAYAKTSIRAGNEVRAMQEATSKAFDGVLAGIGKTTMQLEPLISGFAKVVEKLNEIGVAGPIAVGLVATAISGNPVIGGFLGLAAWAGSGDYGAGDLLRSGSIGAGQLRFRQQMIDKRKAEEAALADAAGGAALRAGQTVFGAGGSGLAGNKMSLAGKAKLVVVDKKNNTITVEILDPDDVATYGLRRNVAIGSASGSVGQAADTYGVGAAGERAAIDQIIGRQRAAFDAGSRGLMNPYAAEGAGIRGAQESQLSKIFGPVGEFDVYAAAFDSLTGAIGSALGAWIDGSMSAGKAFKAFIGEAVKGIAIQMAMEALKHGAYAIGHLAFGDLYGASLHGQAAAQFGAGAVAAAIAAKSLNGSSASPATAGGGYKPVAPNTSAPSGQNPYNAPTIIVGDPFAYDSPRNQQRIAKRLTSMALGTSAVSYG